MPLTDYCDQKRLAGKGPAGAVRVGLPAVQHAHQKGIIHRDLKPGNVLVTEVDGRATPKVIDFGVAKATELKLTDMSFADTGAIVGTPTYMSPEQADPSSMDIDTRTDVYALGVMLYELLTGSPPLDAGQFKRGAILEMLRMVREVDPPRPSTRLSTAEALPNIAANRSIEPARLRRNLLQGDLDWVVMKALEKDRARRYNTAIGFARDIQRYLADEVVEARPPSRGYRLKKFVKRNKGQVIAASLILLTLIAGIVGTSVGLFRADRALEAEAKQRRIADQEKAKAEEGEGLAIDAVKKYRDAVANNPELKNIPALESLRKTLLKEPLAFFRSLRDRLQADKDTRPESLARLADASYELGFLTREIGTFQDALIALRESLAIMENLADANPGNTKFQSALGLCHQNIGILLTDTGRPAEALRAYESALAIRRKLANTTPESNEIQHDLAVSYQYIGDLLRITGKSAEALKAFGSALLIRQKLADANPKVTQYQSELAASHYSIGSELDGTGKRAEALKAHESALAIRQKLADVNPEVTDFQVDLAASYNYIGVRLTHAGRLDEAMTAIESAAEIRRKLADANPTVTNFQAELASSLLNIGVIFTQMAKPAEALKAYKSALARQEKVADANPTVPKFQHVLASCHLSIALILRDHGQPAEALKAFESASQILKKLVDNNLTVVEFPSELADCLDSVALLLYRTGKSAEAVTAFESALALRQKLVDANPTVTKFQSRLGMSLNNVAAMDLDAKRFELARGRLRESLKWQRMARESEPANPDYRRFLGLALPNLIAACRALGDSAGAAEAERELAELHDSDPAMKALDSRLAAIINGEQEPTNEAEGLRLAQRAYDKALHKAAAKLWGDAIEANPKLVDDRQLQHRYNAACAAALAGCDKSKDDPPPSNDEKTKLRHQALDWLAAELKAWDRVSTIAEPGAKEHVSTTLAHWKEDTDLAGIRDARELAKLPEGEQQAWQSLWADVNALLKRTQGTKP